MSDETTLLSCPFCGGEAKIIGGDDWLQPICRNHACPCDWTDWYTTEAEAIAAWNTRAERTCKWEYPQGVTGWLGYTVCSSCGERFDECVTSVAHYCPNCGREVVNEC